MISCNQIFAILLIGSVVTIGQYMLVLQRTAIQVPAVSVPSALFARQQPATNQNQTNPLSVQSTNDQSKNPIQLENEYPGTSEWVLSRPALDRDIEGYMSRTSVLQGDSILLFYNTRAPTVAIDVFRTGWYRGTGGRHFAGPVVVRGVAQVTPRPDEYGTVACNWTDPWALRTNRTWTSGVYLLRMTESERGTQSYAVFVVRDLRTTTDVLFQLPVNTYQAYNYWGGKSLYSWGSGGPDSLPWGTHKGQPASKVSFDRPYARSNHPNATHGNGAGEYLTNIQPTHYYPISNAAWNYNMVRWLERLGVDTTYVTNIDVHNVKSTPLAKPKLLLTQGHDEYWSGAMRDAVEAWRDDGVHLAFLGSNLVYMQVRFEGNSTGHQEEQAGEPRIMVCFRRPRADPVKGELASLSFRDVGRPEADLLGVEYIGDPVDTDLVVANASHWLFDGTGLSNGDTIPGMLGYEVDAMRRNTNQMNLVAVFESQAQDLTKNRTLLCHGTVYNAPSGAFVFSAGTIQWSWGLDDYNVDHYYLRTSRWNRNVDLITRNLLKTAGIAVPI